LQSFGERDIDGVIGGKIVPHLPDAGQEYRVSIPVQAKVLKVADGFGCAMR